MTASERSDKWKRFEEFVASIQSQIAPNAVVRHNERIIGKSGVPRQIDVTVREDVGQFKLFIVIDCKDWRNPVDIADVGSFIDLVEDVGANKGAMVCNAGFTDGAKKRAKEKGIDLFKAFDPKSIDWPLYLAIPMLCDFRGIETFSFQFVHSAPTPFAMPACDPRQLEVYNKDGSFTDFLGNLLLSAWDNEKLPVEPGEHPYVKFLNEDAYTRVDGVVYGPVEITARITVQQRLYFGQVSIEEGRGFQNEHSGVLVTNNITTSKLDIQEVEKSWRRLKDINELAVTPLMCMINVIAFDCYPRIKLPHKDKT